MKYYGTIISSTLKADYNLGEYGNKQELQELMTYCTGINFLTHHEVNDKYGITSTFLQVLQIRANIHCRWKRLITTPATQNVDATLTMKTADKTRMTIHEAPSKRIYSYLLKYKTPKVTSQTKWEAALLIPENDRTLFGNNRTNHPSRQYVRRNYKHSNTKYSTE